MRDGALEGMDDAHFCGDEDGLPSRKFRNGTVPPFLGLERRMLKLFE